MFSCKHLASLLQEQSFLSHKTGFSWVLKHKRIRSLSSGVKCFRSLSLGGEGMAQCCERLVPTNAGSPGFISTRCLMCVLALLRELFSRFFGFPPSKKRTLRCQSLFGKRALVTCPRWGTLTGLERSGGLPTVMRNPRSELTKEHYYY